MQVELSEREIKLLRFGLYERERSIKRKRSWRLSEQAIAIAEVKRLDEKLQNTVKEGSNA